MGEGWFYLKLTFIETHISNGDPFIYQMADYLHIASTAYIIQESTIVG